MKRVVLVLAAVLLVVPVMAQQTAQLQIERPKIKPLATVQLPKSMVLPKNIKPKKIVVRPMRDKALIGTEPVYRRGTSPAQGVRTSVLQAPGDSVGFTYYDYQSNFAMPDRVVIYPDEGLAQMVWMAAIDTATDTRGSYYALIDISGDEPVPVETENGWTRMEANRRGWPEIVQFDNGAIGTVAHAPVIFTRNDEVGVDVWTTYQAGPQDAEGNASLWPRLTIDGKGYLHAIYTYLGGPNVWRLGYVRSTDGGQTWSLDNEVLLNSDLPLLAGADSYVIEAQGDLVRVAWVDENFTLWTVSSTDNGETWGEPQAIFGPQFSNQVTVIDTVNGDTVIYVTDTSAAAYRDIDMLLDADGKAHYVGQVILIFGQGRAVWQNGQLVPVPGTEELFLSEFGVLNIGCGYYKEGTQTVMLMAPPAGGQWDGQGEWTQLIFCMSRYPQLGFGEDGTLYCVYTSVKNGDFKPHVDENTGDTINYLYGHLYATYFDASAGQWSEPTPLTPDGVDALYGTLCNTVTDHLYIGYQADDAPGTLITGGYPTDQPTKVMFLAFPVSNLKGVSDVRETTDLKLRAYATPNPAQGAVRIYYTLDETVPVQIRISDLLGRTIATFDKGVQTPGTHLLWLKTQEYEMGTGSYYCTITAGQRSVTLLLKVVR